MQKDAQTGELAELPLVMLPGTLCDERIFAPLRQRLAGLASEVFPTPHARSLEQAAEQVLAQGPDRFILLGFSLGGMVAMTAALRAPNRISGLILISTTPIPVSSERHASRNALVEQAGRGPMKEFVRNCLWPEYGGDPDDASTLPLLQTMAADLGVEAFAAQTQAALGRTDFCPDLHAVTCPVLIVAGQDDTMCPPSAQACLAAALPMNTTAMIPGAGHFALFERADEVAAVVAAWLHRLESMNDTGTVKEGR